MRTIVIEDMNNNEAKKRISEHLNKVDGKIYPSEIADQLHIDYDQCVEVIEELLKEGKIEIVED
jgi:predicted transcriptional regulator